MIELVADRPGEPLGVIRLREARDIALAPNDVLLRLVASPINPSDLLPVAGAYPHRTRFPHVPGHEGVWRVESAAAGVSGLKIGQRVVACAGPGAWATRRRADANRCVAVPDDIDDESAAMAVVNPLTVRCLMEHIGPLAGKAVAISAASSAIGRMLVRHVVSRGGHPLCITRETNCDPDVGGIACWRDPSSIPVVDVALDCVGGTAGEQLLSKVVPGGVFVHFGLLSGQPIRTRPPQGVSFRLFHLRSALENQSGHHLSRLMSPVWDDLRTGLSRSFAAACFPLTEWRSALTVVGQPGRRGKILLTG